MVKLSSNPTCVLSDADVLTNEQAERIAKVLTRHLPGANNVTESGKILGVNAEGDVVLVEDKTGSVYTAGTGLTLTDGEFSVDNPMPSSSGASQGDVLTVGDNGPEWAPGGAGYTPVDLQTITAAPYNIPVGNREDVAVTLTGYTESDVLTIQLSSDCTDAVVKVNAAPNGFSGIQVLRGSDPVTVFGRNTVCGLTANLFGDAGRIVLSTNDTGGSGAEAPTSFSEMEVLPQSEVVGSVEYESAANSHQAPFLVEIKGRNAILHAL